MFPIHGLVELRITCASPPEMLSLLNMNGIELKTVRVLDELNVMIIVRRTHYKTVKDLVASMGASLKISGRTGLYWSLKNLIKRPFLVIGLMFFLLLTLYLPSRVLFVSVSGNENISESLILEKAENCGIYFGASRKVVRSEKVKNRLLLEMPELKWAGINTYGCIAVISVEEKKQANNTTINIPFGNVVATQDAIVTEISTLRGTAVCSVGQAVKKDQILISGYEDLGLCVKGVGAKGEVYGLTHHSLALLSPCENTVRTKYVKSEKHYGILLGKKLINFSKYSGIYDSKCVRMYSYSYIYLPGGFRLPIALVTEKILYYKTAEGTVDISQSVEWMNTASINYVISQMLSGEILKGNTSIKEINGAYCLQSDLRCCEMIGRVRREEIVQGYG